MPCPETDAFLAAVVAEARSWEGTPFQWQASLKGKACDCKGLISGVARSLGRSEADSLYARVADYRPGFVDAQLLKQGLRDVFDPTQDPRPGDILLLRIAHKAQHLAIMTEAASEPGRGGRMIHTYGKGPMRVIEVPMGSAWWNAFDSAWSWREGELNVG